MVINTVFLFCLFYLKKKRWKLVIFNEFSFPVNEGKRNKYTNASLIFNSNFNFAIIYKNKKFHKY